MLLFWRERMNPGDQQRAQAGQIVLGDHFLRPFVIFNCPHDKLDFVGRFQLLQIFQAIPVGFAATRTFEVHDSVDPCVDLRDIVSAAGFKQHSKPAIA